VKKAIPSPPDETIPWAIPDYGVSIFAQLEFLTQGESQRLIRDHFIVGLAERTAHRQRHPPSVVLGPGEALHIDPQGPTVVLALDVVGNETPRAHHARHRQQPMFEIGGHARNLRKRTARAALHHPQVGADPIHHHQCVVDHPAIDAAHAEDDHQEQADAEGREREAP
jgi:hypothetical protein